LVRDHLKAFLEHLRLNENASLHTVRAYESDLSQYLTFLAAHVGRRVSELTPAHLDHLGVRGFIADLNTRGNSKASAARKLSAIRAFGRYLRREDIIDSDPAALVGTPRRETRIPNHLAVEEMTKLLEAPDTSGPLGRRDQAILELFYASGLRLSELVGLDLDDVNLSGRVVRVLGKGRKERIVPFNPTAAAALKAWLGDREGVRAGSNRGQTGVRPGSDPLPHQWRAYRVRLFDQIHRLAAGRPLRGRTRGAARERRARGSGVAAARGGADGGPRRFRDRDAVCRA